ncbi:MAG TPA: DNA-3-methyladenine glycosylase [Flavitalea sp.]|nr:DNA-3-methyladenine glycosylase [Flavitalea sp.]
MKKLDHRFYDNEDVVMLAKLLLGKLLVTEIDGIRTSGRIVETEAYAGSIDRASHAYGGRRTKRTEVMFGGPGKAYVYLCYGIHHLFNIVTNRHDIPHAILVRALEPVDGIDDMLIRTGKKKLDYTLTKGPGNVSRALGIRTAHTGTDLLGNLIYIVDDNVPVPETSIASTARIGVDYAGVDASLLYRFHVRSNPYVSGRKQQNQSD